MTGEGPLIDWVAILTVVVMFLGVLFLPYDKYLGRIVEKGVRFFADLE